MPSRPLSADQAAVVRLFTRLDVEAVEISHGRTDIPAAVARLVQLVPPARVDLVEEVLVRVARRDLSVTRGPARGPAGQVAGQGRGSVQSWNVGLVTR